MNELTNFAIELYEIRGEGGRYLTVTRWAETKGKALAAVRETYPARVYWFAGVSEVKAPVADSEMGCACCGGPGHS